jgi:hypothetical protein
VGGLPANPMRLVPGTASSSGTLRSGGKGRRLSFRAMPRYLISPESLGLGWTRAWLFYPSTNSTPPYVVKHGGVGHGSLPLRWDVWIPVTPRMEELILEGADTIASPRIEGARQRRRLGSVQASVAVGGGSRHPCGSGADADCTGFPAETVRAELGIGCHWHVLPNCAPCARTRILRGTQVPLTQMAHRSADYRGTHPVRASNTSTSNRPPPITHDRFGYGRPAALKEGAVECGRPLLAVLPRSAEPSRSPSSRKAGSRAPPRPTAGRARSG